MQFYWLPPFLAGVLSLSLCLLVLWHAPRKRLNQTFALLTLSLTSWNFDIAALYFFTDYESALYWSEIFRYGMLFIPPTVYHLALVLTDRWTPATLLFLAIGYAITLALCLANSQGALVQQLETFAWGYYPVGNPLYRLHALSDLIYFSATLYLLARSLVYSESARQRQQLKIVFLGFAVALPIGLTNLLPVYGVSFFPLGNLGNVFFCGAVTYAIVKHRLLDVDLIITKTTAGVLSVLICLVPLWIQTVEVQQWLYGESDDRLLLFALAVFALSAFAFPWLRQEIEGVVQRVLWGQKYDTPQALSVFQKRIIREVNQKKIIDDLREVLTDALQTEFVSVYLLQLTAGTYTRQQEEQNGQAAAADISPNDPFLQVLRPQEEPIVREEMALQEQNLQAVQLAATLAEWRSEICVPLRLQDRLIGFVLLGKKRNRDVFSSEDLRLLTTLGTEVAVALENARLYEELRTSQMLLARSDRLAAVGTLAAGIAHEIRNPLVAIHTFAQLLPERFEDPEFRATFSDLTNSELERVSTLINDLMAFARPSPVLLGEIQINDLVEQVIRLLSGQARKQGTTLKTQLLPTLPPFVVDQGQMKQVLLNLLQNALQATESGDTVTVTTAIVRGLNGQEYCELAVQDTGPGIPLEQKEKIFDPFFTTKSKGTGLGLSIVHQIIKEHGGFIDVESTVGKGTRFFARLPLTPVSSQASLFNGEAQESPLPKETSSPHPL